MILLLSLCGLALGAASPSDGSEVKLRRQLGYCPPFWYGFNNRCYKYVATRAAWAEARLRCLSQRADLVSIHSRAEQDFVMSLIKRFDYSLAPAWMGLSDQETEGTWLWSDGCPATFVFWNSGQPDNKANEDCVQLRYGSALKWNDVLCSNEHPFVCASSKQCR